MYGQTNLNYLSSDETELQRIARKPVETALCQMSFLSCFAFIEFTRHFYEKKVQFFLKTSFQISLGCCSQRTSQYLLGRSVWAEQIHDKHPNQLAAVL